MIGRLESLTGVQAAGASNLVPLDGGGDVGRVEVDGVAVEPGREPRLFFAGVTAHYFQALGVPVIRGRGFTEAEARSRSGVALVSVGMARRHFAPRDGTALPPLAEGRLAGAADLGADRPGGTALPAARPAGPRVAHGDRCRPRRDD